MAGKRITKKRIKLLLELERLVASECYNPRSQIRGPGGTYEGEGRKYSYPITFIDEQGVRRKGRWKVSELTPQELITGYYEFGTNHLSIVKALHKVVTHLEERAGVKLD